MVSTVALIVTAVNLVNGNILPSHGQGSTSYWNGWGGSISNRRWAQESTVNPTTAKTLTPHCQLQYTNGESAAPSIWGDIAYFPTWGGLLVALNYKTCQTVWETNITQVIVNFKPVTANQALVASPVSRTTPYFTDGILYLGTQIHALFLAVNATDGAVLGSKQINEHPMAVITQSPTVYDGHILVGVSSTEESAAAAIPGYQCCTFAGNMMALLFDCATGTFRTLWDVSMLPTPQGEWSGIAVWGSQPSIDEARSQVFIATGNVYKAPKKYEACAKRVAAGNGSGTCFPRRVFQESVIALDITSGHINWVRSLSPLDAWTVACLPGAASGDDKKNCPAAPGPDADFGMAPSFISASAGNTPGGQDTLVVGQKNGNLYAISPIDGSLHWATQTSPDGVDGGLSWGVAVDDSRVYFTAQNWNLVRWKLEPSGRTIRNSAWGAANLSDGSLLWERQVQPHSAIAQVPPSVAGGIVFTGRTSFNETGPASYNGGELVMLEVASGHLLGKMALDAPFHGGITLQDEYLLFGTGYGQGNGSLYVLKATSK